jgi:hypothetical protein
MERKQGDVLGQRQSGSADIRVARFPDDTDLLTVARDLAREILAADPGLEGPRAAQAGPAEISEGRSAVPGQLAPERPRVFGVFSFPRADGAGLALVLALLS